MPTQRMLMKTVVSRCGPSSLAPSASGYDGDLPGLEETLAEQVSLRTHLDTQLGLANLPGHDAIIAAYLIDQVDESGYLSEPIEDVVAALGTDEADVERVLDVLRTLCNRLSRPVCFARDLAECLALAASRA